MNGNDSSAYLTSGEKGGKSAGSAAAGEVASSSKKKWIIVGSILAVLVIVGAVVGGVLGARAANDHTTSSSSANKGGIVNAAAADPITSQLPNGAVTTVTPTTVNPTATSSSGASSTISVTPLPQWNWAQSSYNAAAAGGSQAPMVGLALGNWLVLEQWMNEPWFNATADNNASVVDEWTLMQHLGENALSVMTEHWSTWVTEADIESAHQAGINHLRIPVGYWAFLDNTQNEPYLFKSGQLQFLEDCLGWAYKRGMYAIIDLHGLPGSQNGEITSGHRTTNPTFFRADEQTRSDALVDAALAWMSASPYSSVMSALELANEPRPYTDDQFSTLRAYYQRSYEKASKLSPPIPVQFHHGFINQVMNVSVASYWSDFITGDNKDPALVQLVEHPYIGTFPLQNNQQDMLSQVCSNAARYAQFPCPVVVTEWSVRTGVNTVEYERELYSYQMTAWANTGGSVFWNHRAVNGGPTNNQGDSHQWSFLDLIERGSIPLPLSGQSTVQYLQSLGNGCGSPPAMAWASSSGSSSTRRRHRRERGHTKRDA